jgi:leader peptidase (prepilin peptidase)/N-methyltransferase
MQLLDALAASPAFFMASAFVLGLIVGSFLNVVIHRLPLMLEREWREQCAELAAEGQPSELNAAVPMPRFNLIAPRSTCPACKSPITALQNIPILSYVLLRGRCASCGVSISARYPLVEALTAILSALVAWRFGFGWPALGALALTWFLIALTFIDIDRLLLPDNLTLPLMWLGITASLCATAASPDSVPVDLRSSLIGAIAGYVSLWSIFHLFRLATGKEGMGYGDFKLLAALGAWLGWQMLLPIVLMAAAVGAVIGIVVLTLKRQARTTPIPFGPFLAMSGWLMLMFGHELVARYLGLFHSRV